MSGYTYQISYEKLTEVTKTWVKCSFKTTNCSVIPHLKGLQIQEDKGIVKNIKASSINNIIEV
jgi:hypothetical protein